VSGEIDDVLSLVLQEHSQLVKPSYLRLKIAVEDLVYLAYNSLNGFMCNIIIYVSIIAVEDLVYFTYILIVVCVLYKLCFIVK